jgi:hypothetical protein
MTYPGLHRPTDMLSDTFSILHTFMQKAPHFSAAEKADIETFFTQCAAGMDQDSEKLLATIFINALNKKIRSESIGQNIYLGKYEISQIELFDLLIEKFPFVKYSQMLTNRAIVEEMRGNAVVTLIDIGIGQGTQVMNIIEQARCLPGLRHLCVIGIEPYGQALEQAGDTVQSLNGQAPFSIEFKGIQEGVEDITFSALGQLKGKVIVNASLALHHIQSAEKRQKVIEGIRSLQPAAFFLIEPNVNHFEPDFQQRFLHCYRHFYHIFQVIDQIENISQSDKNALKLFFGREIEDIIGKEEKDRFEKHELADAWIKRLKQSDFVLRPQLLEGPLSAGCGVEIAYHREGFVGFTHEDETVLAVMYAC